MKRIFILGISGSGKSTLAMNLSQILNIPHYDLDDIFWIKKYTEKRDKKDFENAVKKLVKKDRWIIEGVYEEGKIASKKADTIIWLDFGINLSTIRVVKRWLKRRNESLKDLFGLIKYVRSYKKIRPNKECSTFETHRKITLGKENKLFIIKNKKQLKELVKNIKSKNL